MKKISEKFTKKFWIGLLIIVLLVAGSFAIRLTDIDYSKPFIFSADGYVFARRARDLVSSWKEVFPQMLSGQLKDTLLCRTSANIPNVSVVSNFLSVMTAAVSKITGINVDFIVTFFNAALCALAAIPAYCYVSKQTGRLGGIVAGLLVSLSPAFIIHSVPGFYDTDAILCLFPVLMMVCLAEMLQAEVLKKKIIWAVAAILSFAVIALSWTSFYTYLIIGVGAVVLTTAAVSIVYRKEFNIKSLIFPAATLAVIVVIALCANSNFLAYFIGYAKSLFFRGSSSSAASAAQSVSYAWPNNSKFVTELEVPPFISGGLFEINTDGFANLAGGILVVLATFIFAVIMLVQLFKKPQEVGKGKNKQVLLPEKKQIINCVFFFSWLVIVLPVVFRSVRFTQLFALPAAMVTGLGIGMIAKSLEKEKNTGAGVVAVFLAVLILLCPVIGDLKLAKNQGPGSSEEMDDACRWISENSEEDAVMASWWDYGYYYQYQAGRRTVGDGGTHGDNYLYWLGSMLMTDSPELSKAICIMLQDNGLDATNKAISLFGNNKLACETLKQILVMPKEDAKSVLTGNYGIEESDAEALLKLTHPDDVPEVFLILSSDMLLKAQAIGYYGFWDFSGSEYVPTLNIYTGEDGSIEDYDISEDLQSSVMFNLMMNEDYQQSAFEPVYGNSQVIVYRAA